MDILGIDHVQITIPPGGEDEARAFYCDLLGLPEIAKPASLQSRGGFWVQAGDRQVHVGVDVGVDRAATKAHIAYRVRNIGECRRLLSDRGIPVEESVPIPGIDRFELRDPFGNRVELLERDG